MKVKQIIADIIKREGGYVNHSADRGGPTNYGITAKAYADYFRRKGHSIPADVKIEEIKNITPQLAEKIYLTLYYVRPNIASLHPDIQPIVLDMAVNHGCSDAIKILQTAINYFYPLIDVDGAIGKKTLEAANKVATNHRDPFINRLVLCRIDYYRDIIKNDPSQAVFEKGWIARAESFRPEAA